MKKLIGIFFIFVLGLMTAMVAIIILLANKGCGVVREKGLKNVVSDVLNGPTNATVK